MEDTIYAVMGTISQTLGVTIALLLAIGLYRLQDLDKAIQEGSMVAVQGFPNDPDIRRVFGVGRFEELIDLLGTRLQERNNAEEEAWTPFQLGVLWKSIYAAAAKKRLIADTKLAMILAFVVMAIAVPTMIAAPVLAARPGAATALLLANAVAFGWTLYAFWRMFRALLK